MDKRIYKRPLAITFAYLQVIQQVSSSGQWKIGKCQLKSVRVTVLRSEIKPFGAALVVVIFNIMHIQDEYLKTKAIRIQ